MTSSALLSHRLNNQQIVQPAFGRPGDIVAWMGAMQGQDYAGAKWSVALRLPGTTDEVVEQALATRQIVRSWVLRGTLHLLAPDDVRWMIDLIRPRLDSAYALQFKKLELDEKILAKSNAALESVLHGGHQYTREELTAALEANGVRVGDARIGFLLLHAAVSKLICLGARRGKEFTYTLLDEWVPRTRPITRDEALARLCSRYFNSHGPATIRDFAWWSGLTITEAKTGLQMVQKDFTAVTVDGEVYWMAHDTASPGKSAKACLLPGFDEYLLGYTDRSHLFTDARHMPAVFGVKNGLLNATIVLNGRVIGTWKRSFVKKEVQVALHPFSPLSNTQKNAVHAAVNRYGTFAEMPAVPA